jgi:peroxiredoxin
MKRQFLFIAMLFTAITVAAQGKPEGLFLNAKAPEFKLKDQSGLEISLKELRKKGPVVVFFYRGNWCPYCSRQMAKMQDSLQLITAKGASVVAITPESSAGIAKTLQKSGAVFPVLTVVDMKVANAYKVAFAVDERTLTRYKGAGIDLLENNAQKEKAYLPVPAIYVVNKEGSIVYRYFDEDYKKRPLIKEIVAEIK